MRSLMPAPFDLWMWQLDPTPDGFAEVWLEINGRLLWSTVVDLNDPSSFTVVDQGHRELQRRC